jgi:hypothetical protein
MNCADARFALEANPATADTAVAAHLRACGACAAYAAELRDLDRRLLDALQVDVPARPLPHGGPYVAAGGREDATYDVAPVRRQRARWVGLAAGVAAVAVVSSVLWGVYPRTSLAGAVVAHMAHEPDAWQQARALPADSVRAFLARQGVRIDDRFPDVTYQQSCWFRGRFVPHLVVDTGTGPVTVLLLPHIAVAAATPFAEDGYRGELVPSGTGSVAVIARGATEVEAAATRVRAAVHYDR